MRFCRVQGNNSDKSQNEWNQNSEVEKPKSEKRHFEVAIVLDPAPMEFENGMGVEIIGGEEHKKRGRQQRAQNQNQNMAANLGITGNKQANQQDAQRHESMDVEQRHRRVERKLDPKCERTPGILLFNLWVKLFPPVPKQQHSNRNGVKQPALSHEHRQWNAFPGDMIDVLVIVDLQIF